MEKDIKKIKKITSKDISGMPQEKLNEMLEKCTVSLFHLRTAALNMEKFKEVHLIGVQKKNIARILTYKRLSK